MSEELGKWVDNLYYGGTITSAGIKRKYQTLGLEDQRFKERK